MPSEISHNAGPVTDPEELSDQAQANYNRLIVKAKEIAQGHPKQALELYERAYKIYANEKLQKRISKIQTYIEQCSDSESDEGDEMVHMGQGFKLFKGLYDKLYAHQRAGVLWMWELYRRKKGGILGDDMGLGKTIQVISFLSGMLDEGRIHAILIVLPVAVICNWEKEFETWSPGIRLVNFHGGSKRDRERALVKISRKGGVCLTSYGMLVNNAGSLAEVEGREFCWDYIVLDEGHKIKNPSNKCSKGLRAIPARNRIILSGTPVQNNLKEMWALFDWTHQGALLGTAKTFAMEFEQPIVRSRQKDATAGEKRLGQEISESLRKIISKYFLRRTKADVKKKAENKENSGAENGGKAPLMPTFTRKNDLIVWVYLSDIQLRIYEDFLNSEEVKMLLNSKRSPLMSLTILKKLCDHPRLMSNRQCQALGLLLDEGLAGDGPLDDQTGDACAATRIKHISDDMLIEESGKMVFLAQLLDQLKQDGHRCLVFSQSLKVLDIIQKVMTNRGHRIARLDGSVKHVYEREDIIKRFQTNKSYSLFLLTTQVGGVGLTLTAADRVVIYDPSWNPATDAQAVDRAFRIGQDKDVVIYRLITCGSIEEKIYRRQVFKDSITKQTTGDSDNPYRYFTGTQLRELFVLDNPRHSDTQVQLQELHGNMRKTDTSLDEHIAFLHTLDMFGISDHDLMFNRDAHVDEMEELDAQQGAEYIQGRVAKAQQQLNQECQDNERLAQEFGKYPSPPERQKVKRDPPTAPIQHPPSYPVAVDRPPNYTRIQSQMDSSDEEMNGTKDCVVVSDIESEAESSNASQSSSEDYMDSRTPVKSPASSPSEEGMEFGTPAPRVTDIRLSVLNASFNQMNVSDASDDSEDENNDIGDRSTMDVHHRDLHADSASNMEQEDVQSDTPHKPSLASRSGASFLENDRSPSVRDRSHDDRSPYVTDRSHDDRSPSVTDRSHAESSSSARDRSHADRTPSARDGPDSSFHTPPNTDSLLSSVDASGHRKSHVDAFDGNASGDLIDDVLDMSSPTRPQDPVWEPEGMETGSTVKSPNSRVTVPVYAHDTVELDKENHSPYHRSFSDRTDANGMMLDTRGRHRSGKTPNKRRSVCFPITPRLNKQYTESVASNDLDGSMIVTEELVALDGELKLRTTSLDETIESNYGTFKDNVVPEAYSTRIQVDTASDSPPHTPGRYQPVGDTDEEEEADHVEESEEEEEEVVADPSDEDESSEEEGLTDEEHERYIRLIKESRSHYKSGSFVTALEHCVEALEVYRGDDAVINYAKRLEKLVLKNQS